MTSNQHAHKPKFCLGQINVQSKNLEHNFSRMKEYIQKAITEKYDLIIFSEMCVPGYFNGDWWESTSNLKECEKVHLQIAKLSQKIDILFGSVGVDWTQKNEDGRVRKYNAAFFASQGVFRKNRKTNLNFWPKTLLPQYRSFDDSRHFFDLRKLAYEKECRIEDLYEPISAHYYNNNYQICVTICEDIWDENYSLSPLKIFSKSYQHNLFVNLSASPFTHGKTERREKLIQKHVQNLKTDFVYVNCVGTQNIGKTIYTFDGSSLVYSAEGTLLAQAEFCEEVLISVNFESPPPLIKKFSFYETTQKILESSVQHACQKWNIQKVVIGASGGIDSALTSVLFTRALGPKNVFLVNLPTQFNSDATKNAAETLAHNLDCFYSVVSIEENVANQKRQINSVTFTNNNKSKSVSIELSSLNFENIQARERGSGVLAAIASALNAVFVCNTNKSEMTIGYGTLYGDIAGFLCPIGDLWKHQVYKLAEHYNQNVFNAEVIPHDIFKFPPSAELSSDHNILKGQGDPLVYEYHDFLFASWVENWDSKTLEDCLESYQNDTIDSLLNISKGTTKKLFKTFEIFEADASRWWSLFTKLGAIKRTQAPPVCAISRRAFGFDYRETI